MWKSTIPGYSYVNGVITVSVEYTNGTDSFHESLDMTGGTIDSLDQKVQGRLGVLNANDDLVAKFEALGLGPDRPIIIDPTPVPVPVPVTSVIAG